MQVRLLGFQFLVDSENLSLDTFMDYLVSDAGSRHQVGPHDRLLFINQSHSKNYYIGLLVTVKSPKTSCELTETGGKLVVKVSELDAKSNLMDFNFFVINKYNGFGLYQYYHQSFSLNTFGYYISQRFNEYRNNSIKKKLNELDDPTPRQKKETHKNFHGKFKWEIIVKKDNIQKLMQQLHKIKSFEYSFSYLNSKENEFKPLSNFIQKETIKFSFSKNSVKNQLTEAISNWLSRKDNEIDSGKIIGIDNDGLEQTLSISNNLDNFGEYSYDDVASQINSLNIDSFHESWIIRELLIKCTDEHSYIFEADIK